MCFHGLQDLYSILVFNANVNENVKVNIIDIHNVCVCVFVFFRNDSGYTVIFDNLDFGTDERYHSISKDSDSMNILYRPLQ